MAVCRVFCKTRPLSISMTKPMVTISIVTGRTDVFCLKLLILPTNSFLLMFCYVSFHLSYFLVDVKCIAALERSIPLSTTTAVSFLDGASDISPRDLLEACLVPDVS